MPYKDKQRKLIHDRKYSMEYRRKRKEAKEQAEMLALKLFEKRRIK